jgi:polyvinyl alcohol dehydrogenase (cytochrome)
MSQLVSSRLSRRGLLGSAAALTLLPRFAHAQNATPVAGSVPWPSYGADLSGDRVAPETLISSENVTSLTQAWRVDVGGPVNGTPIVANDLVILGSYTGILEAREIATGAVVWSYDTGAKILEPNLNVDLGILGSAVIDGEVVYVGDAKAFLHAVNAATGELIWKAQVCLQTNACIWSSPVVLDDLIYVGVASVAKQPGFRGNMTAVNKSDGSIKWKTYSVPEGADGGSFFGVPAIDPGRGLLYAGTQNAYTAKAAPFGNPTSLLALDTRSGEVIWTFAGAGGTEEAPTDDVAFSASPNLVTIRFFGKEVDAVAIGQKSGTFWMIDRESGDMLWRNDVTPAGPLGGMEGTSAALPDRIIVPATNWPDPEGEASGLVVALDAASGKTLWSAEQSAPAASPVAIANDLVFQAGLDGILHAYALKDGAELWSADLGGSASGGIAVAGDTVVLSAATPAFAPFVKAATDVVAFRLNR